jgi:hypothetical protein
MLVLNLVVSYLKDTNVIHTHTHTHTHTPGNTQSSGREGEVERGRDYRKDFLVLGFPR